MRIYHLKKSTLDNILHYFEPSCKINITIFFVSNTILKEEYEVFRECPRPQNNHPITEH